MDIDALTCSTDTRDAATVLADAAATAGYAPSIRNTQPWRWRLTGGTLDLHLVRGRILRSSDPDARPPARSSNGTESGRWRSVKGQRPGPRRITTPGSLP